MTGMVLMTQITGMTRITMMQGDQDDQYDQGDWNEWDDQGDQGDYNTQSLKILLMSTVSVTSASQIIILESFWNINLESSIRLSSTWSRHVYTIVRDTQSSCGDQLTWKAQIHEGRHRVNFDRNLPSSCFVVQYNSLISMI